MAYYYEPTRPVQFWKFEDLDLDEADNGPLSALLAQKAVKVYVRFTMSGEAKPHAELLIEGETNVFMEGFLTRSIALGMNPHWLPGNDIVSTITLGPPMSSGGGAVEGGPERGDLASFSNGTPYQIGDQPRNLTMGSRDFVTQCMIRWKESGMILWVADGFGSTLPTTESDEDVPLAGHVPLVFFDFITMPWRIEGQLLRFDGPRIPMRMGVYGARVEIVDGLQILYAPVDTDVDLE
ncbi:unnamed protein product [Clonostachys rosea]|uniref:Minor tail protein n=1 Tax=Bionectria ochroleuca TaxID=29856 RepID=A0ABY6U4B6_BIOOC|nr:unnamed protein product [Clonostachys rosea]